MNDELKIVTRELSRMVGAWAFAKIVDALTILVGFALLAWGVRDLMRTMVQMVR